ncbi:D-alanyl-D-alanine carboxypeptidase/D-alanyl-D-alanine endopeptidase [Sphingobacterium faecale]|uniref:D-alanyl-D-alanine carboxypeptidase/D-alanyl-D-alanine-endopeptidase n=1 Tax=Sphingobacterium faecale TaxID=2803775 RepID=A0ABS1QZ57_9SPHI|nr:D-alanyl-D-alanine carboxypeptidase/D-alanyl-D-alanine-endopeptidase [Sphingobacterium faecale]MBL1407718.1 D-alanyl-D-alanine carboxypeptidase/D-alanyl-D-alanine-endopeptidase [Sphingobacterium faecale]
MNTKQYVALFYFSLVSITASLAQSIHQNLDKRFQSFLAQPGLKNGMASLHVIDKNTGNTVFEKNSDIGLPTASTLKVITSITALDLLGANYTYKTKLYYTGIIDSTGVLHGDIVIQGSGDPTLGSDRYEQTKGQTLLNKWVNTIKNAGITAIEGRIIGDDRLYNGHDLPGGWIWTDMGNYYGAGISALNWQENKAGINFQAGSLSNPALIASTTTDLSYLQLINTVKTGRPGSGDNVYAYSAPYSEKIYLRGTYGQDLKKTIEISLPDPAFALAFDLSKAINASGIFVSSTPTTGQRLVEQDSIFPNKTAELDIHTSPNLTDIVYWFNQKSINLYGEAILRSIAYLSGGKTSTYDGANYLQKFWQQKLQLSISELDIIDGSGLSPQNNVTTNAMNRIMQYAIKRPWYESFTKSLPIYNEMTMKSGTIGGTLGYTGYHKAKDGKEYTFTIIVYNYTGSASKMRQSMFSVLDILK